MDKIKINNQIVCLRKFVKQAKVHILNKLVKDVKQYQNKKGNDSQLEKYKRKAERLLSEIDIIKKIVPDSVSKMVLAKKKDWRNILTNKEATLYDRSLAMIADYESIQKEVAKFHESNPNLVRKIPKLILEIEQKKNEAKGIGPRKKTKASEIKQNKIARLEKRKSGSETFSSENNTKDCPSKDTEKILNLTNDCVQDSDKTSIENSASESESYESDCELNASSDAEQDDSSTTTFVPMLGSGDKLKAIKTLNLDELMGLDEIPIDDECIAEDSDTVSTELKNDPFFLGKDSVSCNSDEKRSDERTTKLNKNSMLLHKSFREERKFAKFGNRKERREQNHFPVKNINKTSSKIANFKDNHNQKPFSPGKPNFRKNSLFKKNLPSQNNLFEKKFNKSNFSKKEDKIHKSKVDDKPLHPSWEAKRKLKESQMNASAKAKRIVF